MTKQSTLIIVALLVSGHCATAQLKIGNNNTTIGTSSILELEHSNKALLLPRLQDTAKVITPVNGMLIYDSTAKAVMGYQNGAWIKFTYNSLKPLHPTTETIPGNSEPLLSGVTVRREQA